MEVSYHREMKKNYLMIEADEESMQAFEAKMLVGNAIEGLLKFRIRRTDDHCQFCYEITSRQPLGRLLETKSINAVQLQIISISIQRAFSQVCVCFLERMAVFQTNSANFYSFYWGKQTIRIRMQWY